MATRAIRTSADAVDMESDYTKYNFGVKDLWSGLVPKFSGSPLQAQGISLENAITPQGAADSVLGVITAGAESGGSSQVSENTGAAGATGSFSGAGKGAGAATKAGTSFALGSIGVPSPIGSFVSDLTGKAVEKGEVTGVDVGKSATKSALGAISPSLAMGVAAIDAIAAAFGRQGIVDSVLEAMGLMDVVPGFEAGLFGQRALGEGIGAVADSGAGTPLGYSEGDLGTGISGQFGLGATTGLTAGPQLGGLQAAMDNMFAGISATADAIAEAAAAGSSETSLADAVASGNWGDSADSDAYGGGGGGGYDGSGPGADGNTGNPGEG